MIKLRKLNGQEITLNNEWIETMEATPDTTITLTTGKIFIVKESIDEIIEKVVQFKKSVLNQRFDIPQGPKLL